MALSAPTDTEFPVSIVMERRPKQRGPWRFVEWRAAGVLTDPEHLADTRERRLLHEEEGCQRLLWTHFAIRLVKDGAESYWSNLMAEYPSVFVVCRRAETDGEPEPFLVTVNYDQIIGHEEVGDDVYRLPLPQDIHQWLERYVVYNYQPQTRRKRKRADWSESSHVQTPPSRRQH